MQARAFDALTIEWSFDRYSFGRPLASYQELKHRFADMKTWLEASHATSDASAAAVAAGSPDAARLVSVAKAFIGHYGSELLQDCVQMHGGIGVTFEHDLHLYLRPDHVVVNRGRSTERRPSTASDRIASDLRHRAPPGRGTERHQRRREDSRHGRRRNLPAAGPDLDPCQSRIRPSRSA